MKLTKKKIILGVVGLEIISLPLSLPAAANVMDKIFFSDPPRAAFAPVERIPGESTFIIAANTPFSVISSGMVGELSIDIQVSGEVNGQTYGTASQDPGYPDDCVVQTKSAPTKIYSSFRKTADRQGAVITQAVMMTISYDKSKTPIFDIKPTAHAAVLAALPVQPCGASPEI